MTGMASFQGDHLIRGDSVLRSTLSWSSGGSAYYALVAERETGLVLAD